MHWSNAAIDMPVDSRSGAFVAHFWIFMAQI
jgi:hypothetical protein